MENRTLNILLVNPKWNGFGNRKKIKISEKRAHPLTLGIIAGIIKKHNEYHKVRIVDQAHEGIPFEEKFDFVGITVNTYTAEMAYKIAEEFRKRSVPVIFGGVHATVKSDECLKYADSVLVGEAEEKLPELIDDFMAGNLKRIYIAETLSDLSKIPIPDRNMFNLKNSNAAYIQATRGCNNVCKFCYLRYVNWGAYRKRPVNDVIEELKSIKEDIILFVDDNIFVDREFCLDLFGRMRALKKYWWIQAPTTIAYDDELLKAMVDSGCFSVTYGFQTINNASLESDYILQNRIKDYKMIVKKTQKYGILVDGTFIFGFANDSKNVFENTVKMIKHMGLDTYTLYMLTVYPGTSYYEELQKADRLVSDDSSKFDWDHAVIKTDNISSTMLDEGIKWAYNQLDKYYRLTFYKRMLSNSRFLFKSPNLAKFLLSAGYPRKYYNNY